MVYLPPPHLETPTRPGYERAYHDIVATHRRSPLSSASSLILLVAPDVDALCAARMLTDLLKQDDIMHRIVPVSGMSELEIAYAIASPFGAGIETVRLLSGQMEHC